jgi:hypothetical protein
MYFGSAADSVAHFNSLGYACPGDFNPSDFFLDVLSPDNRSPEDGLRSATRITAIGDAWAGGSKIRGGEDLDALLTRQSSESFKAVRAIGGDASFAKTLRNFLLLCWRSWSEQTRNKTALIVKFATAVIFGLLIGGIYSNIGYSQESIQNRFGVLFFMLVNQCFNGHIAVLNAFPVEKNIVNRERSGQVRYACLLL